MESRRTRRDTHDYSRFASFYAKRGVLGSDYVAFRDLPTILSRCTEGCQALDVGCGAGRSTRFLRGLGYSSVGVDVESAMIAQAARADPEGRYLEVARSCFPFPDGIFDLVFSSNVLLEISSREAMKELLTECVRVKKGTGYLVIITNSPEFHEGDWVSCEVDFPENLAPLRSGQIVRVCLVPECVELLDYFWSDADYKRVFAEVGLALVEDPRPLGLESDPVVWKDEAHRAPYVVYVAAVGSEPCGRRAVLVPVTT